MRFFDVMPALGLAVLAIAVVAAGRAIPRGDGPVLVRLGTIGLDDPALVGVALLDLPVPGFAVLRGDLAQIRTVFPLALSWTQPILCTP